MRIKKINNQGSTLLTVIIILAFIGILGSMMLSVTMTNLQMKMIERKSKENFYNCETVLDEIRTGLHELTVQKIKDIYENDILKNMSTYIGEDDLNTILQKKVTLALIRDHLGNVDGVSEAEIWAGNPVNAKSNSIFNAYFTIAPDDISISSISILSATPTRQTSILISEIAVSVTANEFTSRIRTDIVIELPKFSFEDGFLTTYYRMEQPYKNYVLVADGEIKSEQLSGVNTVNGSIYAGKGITIDSSMSRLHELVIGSGHNVITRGDITVKNTGKLSIEGQYPNIENYIPTLVWADNIITDNTAPVDFTRPTTIDIDGVCIVKDDLTLDGNYSNVILKGAYVGYTGTHSALGSSIIVNGSGSSLSLSSLDSLILAGRAHVSVDDNKGGEDKSTDIITGESVAIKSNQKAYLIPGRFITGSLRDIRHNPITSDDVAGNNIPRVSFDDLSPTDINYPLYVDFLHPYKIASRQTIEGAAPTILYYYYLGFNSGKLADNYLREYLSIDDDSLDNTEPFKINELSLPDPSVREVMAAGNLMSYKADATPKIGIIDGVSIFHSTDEATNNAVSAFELDNPIYMRAGLEATDTVGGLSSMFGKITHLLTLDSNRIYKNEDQVVESTVLTSSTTFVQTWKANNPGYMWIDYLDCFGSNMDMLNQTDGKIILVNGDVNIEGNFTGILVANGNVDIKDNASIKGMILSIDSDKSDGIYRIKLGNSVNVNGRLVSMGDIVLGENNTFNILDDSNDMLEQIFIDQAEVLQYIYQNLELSVLYTVDNPADNLVDLSTMIHYRNWRRE